MTQTKSGALALNLFHETGAPGIAVPDGPIVQTKEGQLRGAEAPTPALLMSISTVDPELVSVAFPVTSQDSPRGKVPDGKDPDALSVAVLAVAVNAIDPVTVDEVVPDELVQLTVNE